jgi:hypothetical protein
LLPLLPLLGGHAGRSNIVLSNEAWSVLVFLAFMLIRAMAVAGGRVATCFKFCVLGGGVVEYKYWRKEYCRDVHGTM